MNLYVALKRRLSAFEETYRKEILIFVLFTPLFAAFPSLLFIFMINSSFFVASSLFIILILYVILWIVLPLFLLMLRSSVTTPVKITWLSVTCFAGVVWCILFQISGFYV
ncbi:hypothetical protein [Sporolactobacillus sp. THM19-2]|uniref:hypothetical protein n=1 Tax=Sporolactobacillus sp. THM19-2 TaxID=2511171 RepID=UPI001021D8A5|nr:hypothetical protein [Sporolactobacillus sp. THM19-2]RYL93196.1 hypothetical protein EWH91_04945 [Sporolactobacillus sp. THM19-2]